MAAALGSLADAFSARAAAGVRLHPTVACWPTRPRRRRIAVLAADRQTAGAGAAAGCPGRGPASLLCCWRFTPGGTVRRPGWSLVVGWRWRAPSRRWASGRPAQVAQRRARPWLRSRHPVEAVVGRGRPSAAVIGIGLNLRLPRTRPWNRPGVTDLARCLDVAARPPLLGPPGAAAPSARALRAAAGFPLCAGLAAAQRLRRAAGVSILGEALAGTCVGRRRRRAAGLPTSVHAACSPATCP